MSARWFVIVAILFVPLSLRAQPEEKPLALLVAVANYQDSGLPSLNFTVRDMQALQGELEKLGYRVTLLDNDKATKARIEKTLSALIDERKPGQILLLAMSGHGAQTRVDGKEDALFCPFGCDVSKEATFLNLGEIVAALGNKGPNMVLIDACRNDPKKSFSGDELHGKLPSRTAVLFSCKSGQLSWETNRMRRGESGFDEKTTPGHGVFMFHVLEGLRGKAANSRNEVTWSGLVDYVAEHVDGRAKEWLPEIAQQFASNRGVKLSDFEFQTPHELRNMTRAPVMAKLAATSPVPKPMTPAIPSSFGETGYDVTGGLRFVHFGKNQTRVVLSYADHNLKAFFIEVFDVGSGESLSPRMRHAEVFGQARFSADGSRVITESVDHLTRMWDAKSGQLLTPQLKHDYNANAAAFSVDGALAVVVVSANAAQVFNAKTGARISSLLKHDKRVKSVAFSADGQRVATASEDRTARVWDAETGKPLFPPLPHEGEVHFVAFSPDGSRVVTASAGYMARVWDAKTGQPLSAPIKQSGIVFCASFSPDGERLVTAAAGNSARVWDARSGREVFAPLKHEDYVVHAAFSADGSRVVTVGQDDLVKIWDAKSGTMLGAPLKHRSVGRAAFSPDGTRVVTHSGRTARVWNAKTGELLKTITIVID